MSAARDARPCAVVVFKQTALALAGGPRRGSWRALPPAARHALRDSDAQHHEALREVLSALRDAGVVVRARYRADVGGPLSADLIVTVGGDGTLLDAAGWLRASPILSVNSAPDYSVAVFSGADRHTVRARIREWRAGKLRATPLPRMRVAVNGRPARWPVLNDVLLAHRNPAAMTRYVMRVGELEEPHRGSGLYVATGPGSTGAIRAAGGRILPLHSRKLQYLVREPFAALGPKPRLAHGFTGREGFSLTCISRDTALFLDGAHRQVALRPGDRVAFTLDAPPLRVLGLDPARRRRIWLPN